MLNCGKYSELLVVLISKITPRLDWALRRPSMKSLKLTEPLIIVSCDCDTDEVRAVSGFVGMAKKTCFKQLLCESTIALDLTSVNENRFDSWDSAKLDKSCTAN